jgi:predicted enzyme related to lactoylglutathione lyase
MRRPVHFEIHAENPERAAKFYEELFGWKITKWDGPVDYWLVSTGTEEPGIQGALLKRMGANPDPQEPTPVIAYVCTIDVEDIDAAIAKAKKLGAVEALGKQEVPGVGWQAYYKDSESNIFGMMQVLPQTKMA